MSGRSICEKNMTPEEKRLWYQFLRSYPVKIYRQRVIGSFIVDFYCPKAHLAIEIDGSQHYMDDSVELDAQRSAELEKAGINVMRFTNIDINRRFPAVCDAIDRAILSSIK